MLQLDSLTNALFGKRPNISVQCCDNHSILVNMANLSKGETEQFTGHQLALLYDLFWKRPLPIDHALQNWKNLINLLQTDPYARDMTMLDIINEPDARSLGWNMISSIYKEVADYAHSINPGTHSTNTARWGCMYCLETLKSHLFDGTTRPRPYQNLKFPFYQAIWVHDFEAGNPSVELDSA